MPIIQAARVSTFSAFINFVTRIMTMVEYNYYDVQVSIIIYQAFIMKLFVLGVVYNFANMIYMCIMHSLK